MTDRIVVAGLDQAEQAWYDGLDEEDLKKLEKGYFTKVHGRRIIGRTTYASFVKVCAAVAVRMHAKQNRREQRNMERLAKLGGRDLGDDHDGKG